MMKIMTTFICFQGEFDVIKELLEKNPIMVEAKRKIDRVSSMLMLLIGQ